MIRANLKAGGGSVAVVGSEVQGSQSEGVKLNYNNLPSDTQLVAVYTSTSDVYGSNFTAIINLSDLSNPVMVNHTGGYGALSNVSYNANTLTLTFATLNYGSMVTKAIPMGVV